MKISEHFWPEMCVNFYKLTPHFSSVRGELNYPTQGGHRSECPVPCLIRLGFSLKSLFCSSGSRGGARGTRPPNLIPRAFPTHFLREKPWGRGCRPPPPYLWTKLRPKGPKKCFSKTAPALSQGLDDRPPLS